MVGVANVVSDSLIETIQSISVMKDEILDIMQTLSATSEENSAISEEMTAAMIEQANSMESLPLKSNELEELAHKLEEMISQFKLE